MLLFLQPNSKWVFESAVATQIIFLASLDRVNFSKPISRWYFEHKQLETFLGQQN